MLATVALTHVKKQSTEAVRRAAIQKTAEDISAILKNKNNRSGSSD
jgi:hypothetical protein